MDLFLRVRVFGGGGGGSIRFVVVGDCWEWSESVSATSVAVVDQHMSSCCSEKQGVTGVWGGLVEFMTVQTVGIARGIIWLSYLICVCGRTVLHARIDQAIVCAQSPDGSRLLLSTALANEKRGI